MNLAEEPVGGTSKGERPGSCEHHPGREVRPPLLQKDGSSNSAFKHITEKILLEKPKI